MFGREHIVWLASIACAAVIMCYIYRRLALRKRRIFELFICWTIFILDMFRYAYLIILGEFNVEALPLHLCSMAVYISLANALFPGKIKREILYSLCMPGAAMALIFPAWTEYPMLNIVCLQCFIIHALLVIYPMMLFAGGELKPDYKNLPKCFLFLAVISPPIYIFNKAFNTNFLFLNTPSAGSPLVPFEKWFGNPGYIMGILIILIIVWAVLYLPNMLSKRIRKFRSLNTPAIKS